MIGMKEKRYRGHYLLTGSATLYGASKANGSSEQGGALSAGGLDTRQEIRKDDRRYRKIKFLLPQETTPSKSQIKKITVYDRDKIEQSDSTPMFVHPISSQIFAPRHEGEIIQKLLKLCKSRMSNRNRDC